MIRIALQDDLINPPERIANGKAIVLPLSPETVGHGTHTSAKVWESFRRFAPANRAQVI